MENITELWHYYRSSCSWRVRWAAEIKGLPCRLIPVNLLEGEQRDPVFLQKNPMGQVPALKTGDRYYAESVAILEWLEESIPAPALLPSTPQERLYVRQLVQIIAGGIQPLQNLKVLKAVSSTPAGRAEWARQWIRAGFRSFEQACQQEHGSYSYRGQLTFADLCLIPQVYNAKRFAIDMGEFPVIEKIYEHCLKRPDCIRSSPESVQEPVQEPVAMLPLSQS